jgi:hypothetical protein
MPPPMHSAARPFFASRRCISCSSVTRMRQPDAPIGWPMAMAPPLTLTLAGSMPSSLLTAQACAAKASFSSNRSTSRPSSRRAPAPCAWPAPGPCPWWPGQPAGAKGGDARQRRQAQGGGLLGAHHHHRGGAVVHARGVARGHAAGLVKGRAQAGQGFGVGLLVDEFVGREDDRVALLLRDRHADDLVLELAGVLRGGGLLLAGQRQRVLHVAADAVGLGHVLGGDAHVVLVVHVPQAVDDHGVDHLPVAHALAVARAQQHVRRQRSCFPGHRPPRSRCRPRPWPARPASRPSGPSRTPR